MEEPLIVDLLEELAESFGLQISYEPIKLDEELGNRPGGVCLLRGFTLAIEGVVGGEERTFTVGIGKEAQAKHQFEAGEVVSGKSEEVQDPKSEVSEYYKTSELKIVEGSTQQEASGPPWHGVSPTIEVYRERGHRRLDTRTYESKCRVCIWGCRMPVQMIIDQWNPRVIQKRYNRLRLIFKGVLL